VLSVEAPRQSPVSVMRKFQSVCGHPASSQSTILRGRSLEGITEVRPGAYTLFDLTPFYFGLCALGLGAVERDGRRRYERSPIP